MASPIAELNVTLPAVRDELWQTLQDRRSKTISPAEANATANVAGKLISTFKVELDIYKLANRQPDAHLLKALGLPAA